MLFSSLIARYVIDIIYYLQPVYLIILHLLIQPTNHFINTKNKTVQINQNKNKNSKWMFPFMFQIQINWSLNLSYSCS